MVMDEKGPEIGDRHSDVPHHDSQTHQPIRRGRASDLSISSCSGSTFAATLVRLRVNAANYSGGNVDRQHNYVMHSSLLLVGPARRDAFGGTFS